MTELEELMEQKKAIEQKIRLLRDGTPIVTGCAKLDKEVYPTSKPDRYYVAVSVANCKDETNASCRSKRWKSISNGQSREDAISGIPEIVNGLIELYERFTGNKLTEIAVKTEPTFSDDALSELEKLDSIIPCDEMGGCVWCSENCTSTKGATRECWKHFLTHGRNG